MIDWCFSTYYLKSIIRTIKNDEFIKSLMILKQSKNKDKATKNIHFILL